jgi:hypothetical protein
MRRRLFAAALLGLASLSLASAADTVPAQAHGVADGTVPAWTIRTQAPAGWTQDNDNVARWIGAPLTLYQGKWDGKPERVIVLNVWPRQLPSLTDEWGADQKQVLQRDPKAVIAPLALGKTALNCRGFVYHGSDQIDDALAFCEPDAASGIRLSWSMAVATGDPAHAQLLAHFLRVVEASRYARDPTPPAKAAAH